MRHFNYFENGGPAPSSCVSCNRPDQLFDLGRELLMGGIAQICRVCVQELATFIGYAEEAPLQEQIDLLKNDIEAHEIELARVPEKVEGLINGIRSSVTDFIFAVSYGIDADKPASVQDDSDASGEQHEASKTAARQRKAPVKSVSE
jgi:hypothetical protein